MMVTKVVSWHCKLCLLDKFVPMPQKMCASGVCDCTMLECDVFHELMSGILCVNVRFRVWVVCNWSAICPQIHCIHSV